jgi:hypothetical protein
MASAKLATPRSNHNPKQSKVVNISGDAAALDRMSILAVRAQRPARTAKEPSQPLSEGRLKQSHLGRMQSQWQPVSTHMLA